eukprot:TRINITY_DN101065_c0_g1_i1.p1 TRINITY_DN101065_c0_g1~~TRINITY_DN101065_c0_g1_i1.p1  ORF type:complete len:282 (-),score=49.81 TRINITY_DN101065_c0_g1_i1:96-941(-)
MPRPLDDRQRGRSRPLCQSRVRWIRAAAALAVALQVGPRCAAAKAIGSINLEVDSSGSLGLDDEADGIYAAVADHDHHRGAPSSLAQLEISATGESTLDSAGRRRKRFKMNTAYTCEFNGTGSDDIIDLTSGMLDGAFSIEFTARWDSFRKWAHIFDFTAGEHLDNIKVANTDTPGELWFEVYNGPVGRGFGILNAIELGVMATYLLTVSNTGVMTVWKDGKVIGSLDQGQKAFKAARDHFWVAKSDADNTAHFHGLIKDLYIWPNEATAWGQRDGPMGRR